MSRHYDARGKVWNKVKRKRTPGYPPKSSDPHERTETTGIGLAARKPVGSFRASRAGEVAANLENRTDKADRGGSGASKA